MSQRPGIRFGLELSSAYGLNTVIKPPGGFVTVTRTGHGAEIDIALEVCRPDHIATS